MRRRRLPPSRRVAMRRVPPTGPNEVYYLLSDHLEGTVEVVDANGITVSEQKYYPFGAVRSGAVTQTDKQFTVRATTEAIELFLEGGPQSGGNVIDRFTSCVLNPFACSGYAGQLTIGAAFDASGHFSIRAPFEQTGGPLPVVNGNLPFVDVYKADRLLAVSQTRITMSEIFNQKLVR